MNSANTQSGLKVLSYIFVGFFISTNPGLTQPITPANDGTNTIVSPNGNQFNINGGTRSSDGSNLFHSFERFGLEPGQVANFLSDPAIRNILGRVTGGEASIIQGLIEITGGNSNLFLINPAGIIFGAGASLNVPADFTATTATGISFNNNWFNVSGTNNFNDLNGNPSGYAFAVTQPGVILNEGNLTLSSGHNLTLLGGTVINTGELSTAGGNINIVAVEGENLVRISQEGQLLNLEVSPLNLPTTESTITPLTLPQLLTGSKAYNATNVTVNEQGQVILTGSNTIIPEQSGVAIASGNINVSTSSTSLSLGNATPPTPLGKGGDIGNSMLLGSEGENRGGNINVFGNLVGVIDANLNASGINGGGTILIGGDFQGNGTVPNAAETFVNSNSLISANALDVGDGGRIIIWSDENTQFQGNISAKGGEISGNGGFVEISGKQNLVFQGSVDVSAVNGIIGTILFDPENITIDSEEASPETTAEPESTTEETETQKDPFQQDEDANITISANNIEELEGNVILQADNDITVNEAIETNESVELKAGRSINLNADIDTAEGNGDITLQGNFNEANVENRAEGAANINQQEGTRLNAGSGNILIELGKLGEVGDINLANINTKGEVSVNANGGDINRVSEDSLIIGGNALFQTAGKGGIGTETEPLRIQANNLEAISGSGGIVVNALLGLTIGGVDDDITGLSTQNGGDIVLNVEGDLTVNEHISTRFTNNQDAGDITIITQGEFNSSKARIISSFIDLENGETGEIGSFGNGGNVTIKANGNIVANFIESGSNNGNGGNITLNSTNGYIDNSLGGLSSSSYGNAGNINLTAKGNITTSSIDSYSNNGDGGDINLESQNGYIDTSSKWLQSQSTSGEGDGGNINLTAKSNITTSYIDSYSTNGNGGNINIESKNGYIDTSSGWLSSSSYGDGGNISLTANENITTGFIGSGSDNSNGGDINLETKNGYIDTSLGELRSSSYGDGGNINLNANGNITTGFIRSSSGYDGNGGNISLESKNGNIDTSSGELNSSYGGGNGGNINLNAKGIVITGNIDAGGYGQGGDITLISNFNDVLTLGDLVRGSSKVSISAFGNIDLGTITGDTINLTPDHNNLDPKDGEVKLQAHNDITIREPLNLEQVSNLEIRAGRNINIKADIDTSEGNGNIFLHANDKGAETSLRGEGTGNIIMAEGTTLNAGSGNITLQLGHFGNESNIGNIIINNLETTGNITINALGGNILPSSPSALIQAENAIFQTKGTGGIGQLENPLHLDVNSLEAVTGQGGAYFRSPQGNLTVGRASSFLNGITALDGGDIELKVGGELKVQEPLITDGGNITLNAEGSINTTQGDIRSYSYDTNGGNITLLAKGDIQTGSVDSSTYDIGDAGNIKIESTGGSIDTTQGDIQCYSYSYYYFGNLGNITLLAKGDIQTGSIYSSSQNDNIGDAGNIKIESIAGSIDTTQGDIHSSSYYGNGGNIALSARDDIQTGSIYSSSYDIGDAGNIKIESTEGSIDTTQGTISSSASSNAGNITLLAKDDIQTGSINGGNIEIESTAGSINTTEDDISSSSENGNSGNITLSAQNNIITGNIYSYVQEDIYNDVNAQGNAGNITLESRDGSIDTTQGNIFSSSVNGNSGSITLSAAGDIRTRSVDVASAFNLTSKPDPNTGIYTPVIDFDSLPIPRTSGLAGDIRITSTNGSINTTGGTINSQSPDGSGNIILNANGDITTGLMTAAALNSSKATDGGNVSITSDSGNINITQNLETFSELGTAGNVTLNTSGGNITTQAILSNGYEQGGNITIGNSDTNAINLQNSLTTLSDKGRAGNVNLTANDGITINGIHSEGLQQGGNLEISAENGNIDATKGNLETFSDAGIAGNVRLTAIGSVNTSNITSFGQTQSGNVTINSFSNSILTQNITTQSDNGPSGNIFLNSLGLQGNIQAANLYSIGNTQSGDITIIAEDGSIRTENILTYSQNGNSGDVDINAKNGSVTTGDVESISDSGNSGDINIKASEDANLGNVRTIAGENSGDVNINSSNGAVNTQNIESIAGNTSGNIDISAQNNIDVGKITTSGGVNSGTVNLNSETGQIYHQGIQIGDEIKVELPNNLSSNLDTTPSPVSIPVITPDLNFSPQTVPVFIQNPDINNNPSSASPVNDSSDIPVIINNNLTILPTPENTNHSSNNILDTSNLAQYLQLNSYSPLALATNAAFLEIEQTRTQEFKTYLGEGFTNLLVTTTSVRDVLKTIQEQTGNHSAVVYVSLKPQQIELIVFDATGQPYLETVPISRDEFLKVKREFMETITSPRLRKSNAYLAPAQKLYQWLIQPIESRLKEAKIDTLLLSMDSGLRGLPIAALHDGKQFLVEKYSLSLIPSISLMDTEYKSLGDAPVLGMGASEFMDSQALPAVALELAIITEKLRQGKSFINEEFTQANLIKQRQNYPYRIIHLATHTEFQPGNLENSYIQLWQDEKLYFNQFRQLKLNNPPVDLLVLSSCRTAIGNEQAELGFAGLAVQTGVKSVLASLWYVNDEGTLGLMSEFYTHLNQSPIKAEALRQAQISMIQGQATIELEALQGSYLPVDEKSPIQLPDMNRDFSHPYYWSGFTMVGSPW